MMIDEHRMTSKNDRLREQKEIKVKIPLDYHVRLHTTKVIEGQSISETVQIALANYFASIGAEVPGAADASSSVLAERAPSTVAPLRAP